MWRWTTKRINWNTHFFFVGSLTRNCLRLRWLCGFAYTAGSESRRLAYTNKHTGIGPAEIEIPR